MADSKQNDQMAKTTITAFIEDDLKEGLKALADVERRSMSQMVALLVERAVNEAIANGTIKNPSEGTK